MIEHWYQIWLQMMLAMINELATVFVNQVIELLLFGAWNFCTRVFGVLQSTAVEQFIFFLRSCDVPSFNLFGGKMKIEVTWSEYNKVCSASILCYFLSTSCVYYFAFDCKLSAYLKLQIYMKMTLGACAFFHIIIAGMILSWLINLEVLFFVCLLIWG